MDNRQSLLAFPLSNLNKIGIISTKRLPNIKLFIIGILAGFAIFDFFIMTLQFFYIRDNFEHYLKNCDGVLLFGQILVKWLSCLYNKNKFINLITYTDYFWNSSDCSSVTKENIKNLSHRVVFAQKIWLIFPICAALVGDIVSVYSKELIVGYWGMENQNLLFTITWISLLICAYPVVLVFTSFDGLFLGCCFEAILQCKILCNRLEQLSLEKINDGYNSENFVNEMKSCIKHHVLLLRFHSELQNAYSVPLMAQYITNVPYIIVQFYGFSVVSSFNSFLFLLMCNVCAVSQTLLYCITANQLSDELSVISDAIYNSDWYSQHFPIVTTTVLLMIRRAQQPVSLSACGLVKFNIDLLVKILKFGLSTCITLRNINNMEE